MQILSFWQNLIGAELASNINGGSLEIIDTDGSTVLGTFTLSASNSSGTVTVTASNVTASATGTAAGAILKDSGANSLASGQNNSFAVAVGDQSTGADTFTETGHGLYDGQLAKLSANLPTTTPTINADQPIVISVGDANTFQLLTEQGGDAVDITAAAGGDTTVTALPLIVGVSANNPEFTISSTSITSGDALSLSSWTLKAPIEVIVETT